MHIKIVLIEKVKEKSYLYKIKKYLDWLSKDAKIEIITFKKSKLNNQLKKIRDLKKNNFFCIFLSENGKNFDSNSFSKFIFNCQHKIVFIMGGPDGYPKDLLNQADFTLSLSKMTIPHGMATLVLIEQIYRAFSIKKGSKYHRD